jgi:hypothetical protein
MNKFLCSTLLAGLTGLTGVIAAPTLYAQDAPLPMTTTEGDVSYLSGGIGIDESTAMKNAASQYSLELVFSAKAGASNDYLANVHVKISGRAGKTVIDTVSQGPYFLANLPDGNYLIEVSSKDVAKTARMTLKKGSHQRLVFSWPG